MRVDCHGLRTQRVGSMRKKTSDLRAKAPEDIVDEHIVQLPLTVEEEQPDELGRAFEQPDLTGDGGRASAKTSAARAGLAFSSLNLATARHSEN